MHNTLKPGGANNIAYLHGWMTSIPLTYPSHIEHLVKQGNYVIFPQYQEGICLNKKFFKGAKEFYFKASLLAEWLPQAIEAVHNRIDTLPNSSFNNLYIYGQSMGGSIAYMGKSRAARW